ncbi:general stress protein [Muricoccus radiodurans]|uniref:general stress protein n=1 Tax=Muricoccus radiodurans TaxID=2231721 RepID=UPI003CEDF0A3
MTSTPMNTETGIPRERTAEQPRSKPLNRGNFASDPSRAAAAGRKGGLSVAPADRSFARNPALAAEAGRKGGKSVPAGSRSFSQDRSLAAQAGRKGGQRSHGGRPAGAEVAQATGHD